MFRSTMIVLGGLLLMPALIVPYFRDNVVPTRDLATGTLTVTPTPSPVSSVKLYANGLRQRQGVDYTVVGNQFVPTAKNVALYKDAGTSFLVDYKY